MTFSWRRGAWCLGALVAACHTTNDSPPGGDADVTAAAHQTCNAYIACIQKVAPTTGADVAREFGDGGGCFGQGKDDVCGTTCAAELQGVAAQCDRDGAVATDSGRPDANGADANGGDTNGSLATVTGKVVDLSTRAAIAGATVQAGTQGTSGPNGAFSIYFVPNAAFRLQASMTGYWALVDQQISSPASIDLGDVVLMSENTGTLLTQALPGYLATGGLVNVTLVPQPACASEGGATVAVSGGGSAKVIYTRAGFPDAAATSAEAGAVPHALIYNLTAGAAATVSVSHPTCTPVAFPVTVAGSGGAITYVSAIATPAAGKSVSRLRLFLK